jgi:hypothetical protein
MWLFIPRELDSCEVTFFRSKQECALKLWQEHRKGFFVMHRGADE